MRKLLIAFALCFAVTALPVSRAEAAPEPVVASLLSVASTLVPLAVTAGLFFTGRGTDEGIRFDIGMTTLGLGVIVGPSVGQIYGSGGVDAFLTFLLRGVTGATMLTGIGLRVRGRDEGIQSLGTALSVIGAIPTLLLALWDIIGASTSAKQARYDAGHGYRTSLSVPDDLIGVAVCGPIPCPVGG